MGLTFDKRVADPVHGSIPLTCAETRILGTRIFQRLINVRQLGLAHLVYPGADYSRLSHSLGVCHLTWRMLEHIRDLKSDAIPGIDDNKLALYRIAGLLHDVGHYPFSHAAEQAISDFYSRSLLTQAPGIEGQGADPQLPSGPPSYKHEQMGKLVISRDPELQEVFKAYDIDPAEVSSIFMREKPQGLENVVSSDLDADRIDYLLRTARHTGLPYGSVDLDYLISQLRVDKDGHLCITRKALKTADHFLLCRYFDYQQVSYHKTVAGLELVLKDVIVGLLETGALRCSATDVSDMVNEGKWRDFDDGFVLHKIRDVSRVSEDRVLSQKALSIVDRHPPKLVAESESFKGRDKTTANTFAMTFKHIESKIQGWADHFSIPRELWYIWTKLGEPLISMSPYVPTSATQDGSCRANDELEQSIRVLDERTRKSTPLPEVSRSLMSVLASHALYSCRVYVLLSADMDRRRAEIEAKIRSDLPELD